MFRSTWTLAHFRKVPIRMHVSLVLVLPVVAWAIGHHTLPQLLETMNHDPAALSLPPLVFGVLTSLSLFGSVLFHEIGHAYVALAQGARVRAITLMILGGVTEIDQDDATPTQNLRTALAGPFANIALGVVCMLCTPFTLFSLDLHLLLFLFACLNLFLGFFNLVPAFPLDGGRAVKAMLRWHLSDIQATQVSATLSRFIAVAMLCFGILRGDFLLAFLAVFLFLGAKAEVASVQIRDALEGLKIRQAMSIRVVTVGPDRPPTSVARHMLVHDARAAVVRDLQGVYGVVLPKDLRAPCPDEVGSMVDGQPIWANEDDNLAGVAREIRWHRKPALVIDASNAIIGVVTVEEIIRAAELKRIADRSLAVTAAGVERPQSHS